MELTKAVPRRRAPSRASYAGFLNDRRVLLLSADGKVVRGRPRGSWISSQHRWAPIDTWLREKPAEWTTEAAQAELIRRWLRSFGPGTVADLRWWTGLTAREVQRALGSIGSVEVDLDGEPGVVLADDAEPVAAPPEPWVALLSSLDPTPMGWKARDWFLGPHAPLFDRSGNIGPSVWLSGRIVGGWAQRPSGEIAVRLLEDIGKQEHDMVDEAAGELGQWLGGIRVTPRFRTPLERELTV
jgi:hypothetical protein